MRRVQMECSAMDIEIKQPDSCNPSCRTSLKSLSWSTPVRHPNLSFASSTFVPSIEPWDCGIQRKIASPQINTDKHRGYKIL